LSQFTRNSLDAIWFVLVFILLHSIESLRQFGVLPVLWKFP